MGDTPVARSRRATPSADQLAREQEAVKLRQENRSYGYIAETLGFANKGGAHKAVERGMRRGFVEPAAAVRELEADRLDRLSEVVWEILLNTALSVEVRLRAVDRMVRLMERRARLLGLDHADGIAERQLMLEAAQVRLLAVAVGRAFDAVDLPPEARKVATTVLLAELRSRTDESGGLLDDAVVDQDGRQVQPLPESP